MKPLSHLPGCQLWLVDLDQPCDDGARACLSADEVARAVRFVFEIDRKRSAAARCALRQVLAAHTGTPAAALRFGYGPFGKPTLVDQPECAFNLSHTGGWALIGVLDEASGDAGARIGVDLEVMRVMPDIQAMAQASFHGDDTARLASMANPPLAFMLGWTRREACLKSMGLGLSSLADMPATGLDLAPSQFVFSQRAEEAGEVGDFSLSVRSFRLEGELVASVALASRLHSRAAFNGRECHA